MSGAIASFDYQTFLESLSEGDCFTLAEPILIQVAHFEEQLLQRGQVVDCSSIGCAVPFRQKTHISADDDWREERRATPGLCAITGMELAEQYNYIRLPYNE